jgi:hypothetical protein
MTYADLHKIIRGKTNKNRRKISNNTWGEIDTNTNIIYITLHNHLIITAYPDNVFMLSNAGYRTVTTKRRLNQFTPFQIWQKNFEWYTRENGKDIEFHNGMLLVG